MGKNSSLKRILVISYCFPPQKIPRAAQLFKFFRYFGQFSDFIFDVITINPRLSSEKVDESLVLSNSNINIHYAIGLEINQSLNYFVRKFFDYMLDGKLIWRFFACRKALKLLKNNNYEMVVTFSQYFSSAVVGAGVKRRRPEIPLISYFSDPWLENPYFPKLSNWRKKKNNYAESQVMELSDKIVFSNQETFDIYAKKYGQALKEKSLVIPHAYDLGLYDKNDLDAAGDRSKKIKIIHTGNFYGIRTPKNFLRALKKLREEKKTNPENIEIYFYGEITSDIMKDLKKEGLDNLAIWKKPVPYLESLKLISSANILLTIDASLLKGQKSMFLPSKLIDYFGAIKPILAITPKSGVVEDLIRTLGARGSPYFFADASNVDEIADVLEKLLHNFEAIPQSKFKAPEQFDIRNIGEKWKSLFLSC